MSAPIAEQLAALTPYEVARALADGIEEVIVPPEDDDPAPWSPVDALLTLAASPAGIARAHEVGLQCATNALRELRENGAHHDAIPSWIEHDEAADVEFAAIDFESGDALDALLAHARSGFGAAVAAHQMGRPIATATETWFRANEARLAKAFDALYSSDAFEFDADRCAAELLSREQQNATAADPMLDGDEFMALVDARIAKLAVDKREHDIANWRGTPHP